jgi:hypothetical protein
LEGPGFDTKNPSSIEVTVEILLHGWRSLGHAIGVLHARHGPHAMLMHEP